MLQPYIESAMHTLSENGETGIVLHYDLALKQHNLEKPCCNSLVLFLV